MNVGVATATADGFVRDTTTQTFMKDVIEELDFHWFVEIG